MPLGSFVSGAFNMFNQSSANKASAREAQKDRDFQERMAKSAYQNMVQDLEKAGLNKALAYGNTPSRVSGATASQGAATMDSPDFAGALSKRAQAKLSEAQVNSAVAQEKLTRDNSAKVEAETISILAKLPEELEVLKSSAARNNAEITSNPYKLGVDLVNKTRDLIDPTAEAVKRNVSSAYDSYKRNIAMPIDNAINSSIFSLKDRFRNLKDRFNKEDTKSIAKARARTRAKSQKK